VLNRCFPFFSLAVKCVFFLNQIVLFLCFLMTAVFALLLGIDWGEGVFHVSCLCSPSEICAGRVAPLQLISSPFAFLCVSSFLKNLSRWVEGGNEDGEEVDCCARRSSAAASSLSLYRITSPHPSCRVERVTTYPDVLLLFSPMSTAFFFFLFVLLFSSCAQTYFLFYLFSCSLFPRSVFVFIGVVHPAMTP
jgi:hypothetical protein